MLCMNIGFIIDGMINHIMDMIIKINTGIYKSAFGGNRHAQLKLGFLHIRKEQKKLAEYWFRKGAFVTHNTGIRSI